MKLTILREGLLQNCCGTAIPMVRMVISSSNDAAAATAGLCGGFYPSKPVAAESVNRCIWNSSDSTTSADTGLWLKVRWTRRIPNE
jgi:hypothetical protein